MRKILALFFLLLTATFFQDVRPVLAGETANIPCGDYNIVTRKKGDEEQLFRVNTKTGETWFIRDREIGWVKMREQT